MDPKIDYSKLPKELIDKMAVWEKNQPANKQVALLEEIQSMFEELIVELSKQQSAGERSNKDFGALLLDIREAIRSLASVEPAEAIDFSKPIVTSLSKLETTLTASIKAVSVTPQYNPIIKVDSPVVNVDTPKVTVDNKELVKILKADLPKAFDQAIKSIVIPENDDVVTNQLLEELSAKLDSIDVGVRLKPQAPAKVAVTNPDGTNIGSSGQATERFDYANSALIYTATAPIGTADSSTGWTITKFDLSDGSNASGKVATDVSWNNRATGSFA